jgi:hypothetical protein
VERFCFATFRRFKSWPMVAKSKTSPCRKGRDKGGAPSRSIKSALRFQSHVTDAADKVIGGGLAIFHDQNFDGRGLIVRAED